MKKLRPYFLHIVLLVAVTIGVTVTAIMALAEDANVFINIEAIYPKVSDSYRSEGQIVIAYPVDGNSYCQGPYNGEGLAQTSPLRSGYTLGIELAENTLFCLKVIDKYTNTPYEPERIYYYGPFIASAECDTRKPDSIYFKIDAGRYILHLNPPPACIAKKNTHNNKSYKQLTIASIAHPETKYDTEYNIRLMYTDNSKFCTAKDTARGDLIYSNGLMISELNQVPKYFENLLVIADQDEFCIDFPKYYNASNEVTVDYGVGPFVNISEKDTCQLMFREDRGIYANPDCTNPDTMIAFTNTKYTTGAETITEVKIYNAAESDCQKNRGDYLHTFEFWPEQMLNLPIRSVSDVRGKFCIEMSGDNNSTQKAGPFYANPGCKLYIASENTVKFQTEGEEANGEDDTAVKEACTQSNTTSIPMIFDNVGSKTYEVTLSELANPNSTDCNNNNWAGDFKKFDLKDGTANKQTINVAEVSEETPFCLKVHVTGHTQYWGPFPKIKNCTIEIGSTNSVKLDTPCPPASAS